MKKAVVFIAMIAFAAVTLAGCDFINVTGSRSERINDFSGEGNATRMLNIPDDNWKMYFEHDGEGDFKIGLHEDQPVGTLEMRIWTKEEAEDWLENQEDYDADQYFRTHNFHAFTQESEGNFDDFELDEEPFSYERVDGVHVRRGYEDIYDDDEGELIRTEMRIQSIRFYHGEGEDLLDDIIVERRGSIRDSYFHPASGNFYISVIADGEWNIKIMNVD